MIYYVNDVYPTIQGEGVLTGTPMILLRLHGCAVGCPFCDTKETWHFDEKNLSDDWKGATAQYAALTPEAIYEEIHVMRTGEQWVMVTGGEPADRDLKPLVDVLHQAELKVAIETSGTALGHLGCGADWVCVSPKIGMPGGKPVLAAAMIVADEVKHVIGKEKHLEEFDWLLQHIILKEDVQICLQPMSQSQKSTELCLQTAAMRGWRVSLQTHKYLNLR